jgi:apolipoprotein N-acyltransferase
MPFDPRPPAAAEGAVVSGAWTRIWARAARLGGLGGWRRWLAGIALGLVATAAMPPFNLVPALFLAFPGLIWLIDGARSRRQAAADGWRFGFGFFVPTLYWTTLSLFVDIGRFWILVPFALFGLPAFLALAPAAAAAIARSVAGGLPRILVFAAAFSALEWLRGHVPFGGFPWALMGYAWSGDSPMLLSVLQSASLFGIYGVSLVTVLVASLPAQIGQRLAASSPRRVLLLPALGLAGLALLGAWGGLRLAAGPDPLVPGGRLRIVQPDNAQAAEWSEQGAVSDARRTLALAGSPGADRVAAQIWPEGAIDFLINRDAYARAAVAAAAPPRGIVVFGTLHAGDGDQAWNSVAVIARSGALLGLYDKFHLVPFGEYVPLRSILGFSQIVSERLDFATGPGPRTLYLPNLPPVSPIICYEAIFPHAVVDETARPGWIVNVTDDTWFGTSTGPRQHFAITRVRAVEEGLPLVRAGNSGISGVIDAHGRVLARLDLGRRGVLDADLPQALATPPLYARFGDAGFAAMLAALVILGALAARETRAADHPDISTESNT